MADNSIALGIQPMATPDYAGATMNRLNMMGGIAKLNQNQRELSQQNALAEAMQNGFDPNNADHVAKLYQASPMLAGSFIKGVQEQRTAGSQSTEAADKAMTGRLGVARETLSFIDPDNPLAAKQFETWTQHLRDDPLVGPLITKAGVTPEQTNAAIEAAAAQPGGLRALIQQASMSVEKYATANKPTLTTQNAGGFTQQLSTPGLGGSATVVPGSRTEMTLSPEQLLKAKTPELKEINLGGKTVFVDTNPYSPTYNQTVNSLNNGMSPEAAYAAAHPNLTPLDTSGGLRVFNPKTGQTTPMQDASVPNSQTAAPGTPTPIRSVAGVPNSQTAAPGTRTPIMSVAGATAAAKATKAGATGDAWDPQTKATVTNELATLRQLTEDAKAAGVIPYVGGGPVNTLYLNAAAKQGALGGGNPKAYQDAIDATISRLMRALVKPGMSTTLRTNQEQTTFKQGLGGGDKHPSYETRMQAIDTALEDYGINLPAYTSTATKGTPPKFIPAPKAATSGGVDMSNPLLLPPR